jgi:hypothetical protein
MHWRQKFDVVEQLLVVDLLAVVPQLRSFVATGFVSETAVLHYVLFSFVELVQVHIVGVLYRDEMVLVLEQVSYAGDLSRTVNTCDLYLSLEAIHLPQNCLLEVVYTRESLIFIRIFV